MIGNMAITYVRQMDIMPFKENVAAVAGYGQQKMPRWTSIRSPFTPQWYYNHDGSPSGRGETKPSPGQAPAPKIVLHIDDDEEDRMMLEEALQNLDAGIQVQQAESGEAALSYLKQSKEQGTMPCLIVLDINMPGMNGKEVIKEIKGDRELSSLPLVVFTTAPEATYRELAKKEKVELITKPLNTAELINSARKMLQFCLPN